MRQIKFERPKNQRLVHWNERLSRRTVLRRDERTTKLGGIHGIDMRVITWTCLVNDNYVELHALDIFSPIKSNLLVNTSYGYICPNCKTNEYVHSQIEWLPVSVRDRAYRFKEQFGYYCRCCGTLSDK